EVAAVPAGKRRTPARIVRQVRLGIAPEQADDNLRHDASPDRSEMEAVLDQLGFLEHVVPEWGGALEPEAEAPELVEIRGADACHAHVVSERLTRGKLPGHMPEQRPHGQRSRAG